MRKEFVKEDLWIAEDRKLIKKAWRTDDREKCPQRIEFAYQYLYYKNGEWMQVARIDNQFHEGKIGSHIHILKRDRVIWEETFLDEVEDKVKEIGECVIKNIIERI